MLSLSCRMRKMNLSRTGLPPAPNYVVAKPQPGPDEDVVIEQPVLAHD